MRAIRTGSRSADLRPRLSRDYDRPACPATRLAAAIGSMRVELVFTAHPTEIVRRTLLQKHNRIAQILAFRDRPDLTPDEQEESLADLQREIAAAWQTDEVRRARVTPSTKCVRGLWCSSRASGMRFRSICAPSIAR